MWTPRRRKGFELAGTVKLETLGLRKSSASRIRILLAWREIAGPVLDEQTTVSLSRGLLNVVVSRPEAWSLIEPVLPLIASRLADRYPDLKLRRWRLSTAGEEGSRTLSASVEPLKDSPPAAPPAVADRAVSNESDRTTKEAPPDTTELRRRLEAAGRRYLERQASTRARVKNRSVR